VPPEAEMLALPFVPFKHVDGVEDVEVNKALGWVIS
jgi:hypothetical protein